MTAPTECNSLNEQNELAFFRADVCLGLPQSLALENAQICEDIEATNGTIEDAIRADLNASSPACPRQTLGHAVRFRVHDA
ncbi:MAG: hypothetical protein DBY41_04205 [Clostridium sp.]|nr:MAG: hypothetical protein DBY41_04205 [Clostridium sp.]